MLNLRQVTFSLLLILVAHIATAEVKVERFTATNPEGGSLLITYDTKILHHAAPCGENELFLRYSPVGTGGFSAVTVTYLCDGSSDYVRSKASALRADFNEEFAIGYQIQTKSIDGQPFYVGSATFSLNGKVYTVTVGNTDKREARRVRTVAFRQARSIQQLNQ